MKFYRLAALAGVIALLTGSYGCSVVLQKRHPADQKRIGELEDLARAKDRQAQELLDAKRQLEMRLKKEIDDKQLRLEMAERGLVITFVAEVLFDSGKAKVKEEAKQALNEVANVLNKQVSDRDLSIEGHTDNVPIKYSGWKSNWELSTARAVSVLHYLVDERQIDPKRVSATGYGEQRPLISNDSADGRAKNRRVEIVILPKKITRAKDDVEMKEPAETEKKYVK